MLQVLCELYRNKHPVPQHNSSSDYHMLESRLDLGTCLSSQFDLEHDEQHTGLVGAGRNPFSSLSNNQDTADGGKVGNYFAWLNLRWTI